mmetsp:Transcript_18869/g.40633  ORF Transcript_18869/g.40633 Transcript_18869/m.40633 type:complete len:263 (+) Transcript_18869:639-1427(+)
MASPMGSKENVPRVNSRRRRSLVPVQTSVLNQEMLKGRQKTLTSNLRRMPNLPSLLGASLRPLRLSLCPWPRPGQRWEMPSSRRKRRTGQQMQPQAAAMPPRMVPPRKRNLAALQPARRGPNFLCRPCKKVWQARMVLLQAKASEATLSAALAAPQEAAGLTVDAVGRVAVEGKGEERLDQRELVVTMLIRMASGSSVTHLVLQVALAMLQQMAAVVVQLREVAQMAGERGVAAEGAVAAAVGVELQLAAAHLQHRHPLLVL